MKKIFVKCEKCNWSDESTDSHPDFDNLIELDECLKCKSQM